MTATDPINGREIALDVLLEVLEQGKMSHLVLGDALSKYQYLKKQDRAFITRLVEGTLSYVLQRKGRENEAVDPHASADVRIPAFLYGPGSGFRGDKRSGKAGEKTEIRESFRFCKRCVKNHFQRERWDPVPLPGDSALDSGMDPCQVAQGIRRGDGGAHRFLLPLLQAAFGPREP